MFTGIITNLGKVKARTKDTLSVVSGKKLLKGDSISVDGICLTVIKTGKDYFVVNFIEETANKTNIKYLQAGDLVNLELPVTPNSFLSGHIVQGHVDGLGRLVEIKTGILRVVVPVKLSKYIVEKGSISINGISLTVIKTGNNFFTVGIIPYTWENTMLHTLNPGDLVNIEVDILAKYIERLVR